METNPRFSAECESGSLPRTERSIPRVTACRYHSADNRAMLVGLCVLQYLATLLRLE